MNVGVLNFLKKHYLIKTKFEALDNLSFILYSKLCIVYVYNTQ